LFKIYYYHNGSIKKPNKKNQKDLIKTIESKLICPKWHFGQVGHGGKNTVWGFFLLKVLVKQTMISCSGYFLQITFT
jgi:hypothetical protein